MQEVSSTFYYFLSFLIKSVSLDQNIQIAIKSIILFCRGKSSFIYTIPSKDKKILKKVWEECKITTKIEEEGGGLESWSLSHVLLSVIVFTLELTEVNMTCIRSTHPVTESGGFMEPCHFLRIYTASDA